MNSSNFWAITAYFNPCNYLTRRENFKMFYKHLHEQKIPIIVIEMFNEKQVPVLNISSDDIHVKIPSNSLNILWQKERLLNIALDHLPESCDYLAFLDCDILFLDDNWAINTISKLKDCEMVQPFSNVHFLDTDGYINTEQSARGIGTNRQLQSFGFSYSQGMVKNNVNRILLHGHPGMAWAMKRKTIEQIRLFDMAILGGGDMLLAFAAITNHSNPNWPHYLANMFPSSIWHEFLTWAKSVYCTIDSKIDCCKGKIVHFWHGDIINRNYSGRYDILKKYNFMYDEEIHLDKNGLWKWKSETSEGCINTINYFLLRKEDRK